MFTESSASFLTSFFAGIWEFFQITFPGTTVSIFGVFASVCIGLFIFKIITNFLSGSVFGSAASSHYRSGNPNNAKISSDRKGDDK